MKKYLFIIICLTVLIPGNIVFAQFSKHLPDVQNTMFNMASDKWLYTSGREYIPNFDPDFDVWVKVRSVNKRDYILRPSFSQKDTVNYDLYNVQEIQLASTAITRQNASNFKYNVRTDTGEELVPWSTPTVFKADNTPYAYLGKFNCRHKTIILTIEEVKNGKKRWAVYSYNDDNKRAARITRVMVEYLPDSASVPDWKKGFTIWPGNNLKGIIIGIGQLDQITLYHVSIIRKFDGKEETTAIGNGWEHQLLAMDGYIMHINSAFFSKPGEYTLVIKPETNFDWPDTRLLTTIGRTAEVHFTVLPGPTTIPLNTAIFIIVAILVAALRLYFYLRRKQKIATQGKQIAMLQLQSVRSQLNPHFIFNALAGIQNLMNKNEVENANKYLTRFARLTRNVLDDGQKELTSIEHEISLLTDYLEMEQMRFGFKFKIDVVEGVDQQIEIPAMLLQPFVENAVKHGISALKGEGLITVNINKTDNDILLKVTDNGPGFSKTPTTGMGIKLCEERIKLFNSIYKNTTILLHINSTSIGTIITIELKNWL
ncbi:MAG: histidine kinase [Mucilaginibacter sp.]